MTWFFVPGIHRAKNLLLGFSFFSKWFGNTKFFVVDRCGWPNATVPKKKGSKVVWWSGVVQIYGISSIFPLIGGRRSLCACSAVTLCGFRWFFWGVGVIGDGKRRRHFHFMSCLQRVQNLCIYDLYCTFWGWSEPWKGGVGHRTLRYVYYLSSLCRGGFTVFEYRYVLVRYRTKIPDPPIYFSGSTNFFGPKNKITNHQFETSVLDPSMSSGPLSNH